jgi:hypothetical protein
MENKFTTEPAFIQEMPQLHFILRWPGICFIHSGFVDIYWLQVLVPIGRRSCNLYAILSRDVDAKYEGATP